MGFDLVLFRLFALVEQEARMSPFDPDCPKDVRIPSIPTELFMVLRVCTIVRGILARFNCDVSAARVWEPYARRALERAGVEAPLPPKPAGKPWPAGQSGRRARSGASRALLAVEAEDERAAAEREAGAGPGSEAEAAAAAEARASTVTAVVVGGVKTHPLLLVPKARPAAHTTHTLLSKAMIWPFISSRRPAALPPSRPAARSLRASDLRCAPCLRRAAPPAPFTTRCTAWPTGCATRGSRTTAGRSRPWPWAACSAWRTSPRCRASRRTRCGPPHGPLRRRASRLPKKRVFVGAAK